jgi:hypothetical protein
LARDAAIFFHVKPFEPTIDTDGVLLENDEAAWHEATIFAAEVFKVVDGHFRPGQSWSIEVSNKQSKVLYAITISSTGSDFAS